MDHHLQQMDLNIHSFVGRDLYKHVSLTVYFDGGDGPFVPCIWLILAYSIEDWKDRGAVAMLFPFNY